MNKTFTQAAITAVLGGAIALSPTRAQDVSRPDEALKKQLDENNKLLVQVKDQLKKLEDAREQHERDLKALQEKVDGRKDTTGVKVPSDPGLLSEVRTLNDKVDALNKQIDGMMKQSQSLRPATDSSSTKINIGGSQSLSPTVPSPMVPPPAAITGKGTLRIVNDYPVEISMVINEKQSYRIAPHGVQSVDVTAGDFSYQLLPAGGPPVKSTIKDKETVTLRIK